MHAEILRDRVLSAPGAGPGRSIAYGPDDLRTGRSGHLGYTASASVRQNPRTGRSARSPTGLTRIGAHAFVFDALSERLRKTLDGLTGRGRGGEADVDAA